MPVLLNPADDPVLPEGYDASNRTRHMPNGGLENFAQDGCLGYTCAVCHTTHQLPSSLEAYRLWLIANPL